jgi:hypothetical protein
MCEPRAHGMWSGSGKISAVVPWSGSGCVWGDVVQRALYAAWQVETVTSTLEIA